MGPEQPGLRRRALGYNWLKLPKNHPYVKEKAPAGPLGLPFFGKGSCITISYRIVIIIVAKYTKLAYKK
jgi:hypothetical protein